jgi:Pyridoxal-phosphate dependent enzyme
VAPSKPADCETCLGCSTSSKVESTINVSGSPTSSFSNVRLKGSRKRRGTDYLLYRLGGEAERLVCASAGNFAQGLAYAARKRNVPLTVFAARSANPAKVESMRRFGAEVRLEGEDFDEAKAAARALAASEGWRFVEDGREVKIAGGLGRSRSSCAAGPSPSTRSSCLSVTGLYSRVWGPG